MDREIATAIETTPTAGADLIDFDEMKRRPRKPRPEPTPDELLDEFGRAVRRVPGRGRAAHARVEASAPRRMAT